MTKVLLSLDERVLRRIDRAAKAQGLSRSAYVARLAQQETASRGLSPEAALRRLDRLFARQPSGDATAAIRAERDAR
ncbi:hypothetical protein EPN52_14115 [bacterium]|nr:MAG: hypothetical protein EPN52_14115 [bacterium]